MPENTETLTRLTRQVEIYKTLVCSTGNLRQSDLEALEEAADSVEMIVYSYPYGVRVFLYPGEPEQMEEQATAIGLSEEAKAVLRYALSRGCRWLELDRDGDPIAHLPYFDW
jgi:hypothetical protein